MSGGKVLDIIEALLVQQGFRPSGAWDCKPLSGDGSDRRFFRIRLAAGGHVLAVCPAPDAPHGMKEAQAAYHLGRHFEACGAAVPRIHAFDPESGTVIFEDLGDTLLHDLIRAEGGVTGPVLRSYREAVERLAHLQIGCRPGFVTEYCWDTPRYDLDLMLKRESGYFYAACCQGLLGFGEPAAAVQRDFRRLAERAAAVPADYVLHRDFQSRNLMIGQGGVRIIDFQGARLGPLAYDLASLLIDPYANLPESCRQEIMAHYLAVVREYIPLDPESFIEGYYLMALQRNLQILGAFSYLSQQKGKVFFQQFIVPAAISLQRLLAGEQGRSFPALAGLVDHLVPLLAEWRATARQQVP